MNLPYSSDFLYSDFRSRALTSIAVTVFALSVLAFLSKWAYVPMKFQVAIPIVLFSILVPYIVALYNRKRFGVVLQLNDEGISLPRYLISYLRKTVSYDSIYSKKVVSVNNRSILRIDFVGGTYYFHDKQFKHPENFEYLCNQIKENKDLNTNFPLPLISWFVLLLVSTFSLYLLYGESSTPNLDIVFIGAWEKDLILSGEIDRLFSYGLIHENLVHLSTNMFSLALLGLALEHRVGRYNFLIIFCAGTIFSSMGGFFSNYFIVIGASGGVYSLLGAYVMDRYLNPDPNLERYKSTTNVFIIIAVAIESCISLFFANIAISVHLVGFLFGVIYISLLTFPILKLKSQLTFGLLAASLSILFLIRLSSYDDKYVYDHSLRWVMANDNFIRTEIGGWGIATSKIAQPEVTNYTIRILENGEETDNKIDTLGLLYARQDRYLDALNLVNARVIRSKDSATQLARFERAYTLDNPIDITAFANADKIAVDAICDNKEFVRIITHETDVIPNICNNQETIYIRVADEKARNIRYKLDPKFMALPL